MHPIEWHETIWKSMKHDATTAYTRNIIWVGNSLFGGALLKVWDWRCCSSGFCQPNPKEKPVPWAPKSWARDGSPILPWNPSWKVLWMAIWALWHLGSELNCCCFILSQVRKPKPGSKHVVLKNTTFLDPAPWPQLQSIAMSVSWGAFKLDVYDCDDSVDGLPGLGGDGTNRNLRLIFYRRF